MHMLSWCPAGRGLARSSQLLMPSRCMSNYPAHTVVGLPALSPTMTHGNLAKWLKKVMISLPNVYFLPVAGH